MTSQCFSPSADRMVPAMSVSLLLAFVLHSKVTWSQRQQEGLLTMLISFHAVSCIGLIHRFLTFAIVDAFWGNWVVSTLVSIAVVIVWNYMGYDRMVFKNRDTTGLKKT